MRRDGSAEVGATHSTREAGEPVRRESVEGRGRRNVDPKEGPMSGTLCSGDATTTLTYGAESEGVKVLVFRVHKKGGPERILVVAEA